MEQVERHIITGSPELTEICEKSKRLYNQTLYYLRQCLFGNIKKFSENELVSLFAEYNQEDYRALPAQTSQQIVKQCFRNWESYFASMKEWKRSPLKFPSKPKLPKYKKTQFVTFFSYQQIRLRNGVIFFPQKSLLVPLKTKINNICQVRIVPQATTHIVEVVYNKEETNLKLNKKRVLSLDLGLSNLCASANNVGLSPFIINGNSIKAFNQWYNKRKATLESNLGVHFYNSKKINTLATYRNQWVEDKLHKISRFIVNYCIENNIGTIVVGCNKNWKVGINIGVKNNQHFTMLPLAKLIDKLKYKSKLIGITFIANEESYTSKCDALALEPVGKHEKYVGKRIKRGIFQSSIGKLINADGNGAINIARKAKVFSNDFVKSLRNSRQAFCHYRVSIL